MKNYGHTIATSVMAALSLAAAGLLLTTGCDSKERTTGAATADAKAPATLPAGVLLDKAPEGAVEVVEAKKTAQPGDEVTIRGRIGGRVKPFVAGRAIFQLVDSSIPTCAENPGDACPTPWDYCCEPQDQVTAKSATVQLAGPDGKPLAMSLQGAGGLKPMSTVVVRGKVAQKPSDDVMIVNADGLYVE